MKVIKVLFKTDGSVEIEANGFKGKDCATSTKFLRKALGVEASEVRKAEFYHEDEKQNHKVVSQCSDG